MKKKSLAALVVALVAASAVATATPQTQFNQGQFQIDLGAWNPGASVSSDTNFKHNWNFAGGLTYGLTDRLGLQYQYWGLRSNTEDSSFVSDISGQQQEVNLIYSLSPKIAAYAGYNRIHYNADIIGGPTFDKVNNVAQLGLVAKTAIAKNLDIYAKGALGTQNTSLWEAGLGYSFTPDLDLSAGYRHLNTKNYDEHSATFKGMVAMLSYRFGGHKAAKVAEAAAPEVTAPAVTTPAPVVTPAANDYYLNSIHFGFDEDQPLDNQGPNLAQLVNVAKSTGHTIKLVGNTDGKGSDSYNMDLSKRRVDNVKAYAVNQGVKAGQLVTMYKGMNDPASTNATDQGRADNRRVDVYEHK
jgi:OOP family OmpA-OmpF porin